MSAVPPFVERVRSALGDERLHVALGRATEALRSRRASAFASLEDSDRVRDLARKAKLEVLADLASQLQRFEERLVANGVEVHWAETGEEANRLVLEIARRHGVKRIVKSKSMATEETHLNHALERAGMDVVETDLGEYIVQLNQDRPSHIILPIIHLTREDVGAVMHRRIQVPLSDDPRTLAGFARAKLREEFLRADMGITGANFGVVETGTICLVTNEGNGRMVTTLPRVHVAVMGIEKLVPTLEDLDLFLRLLARSATGQKITTYTTLLRGPRRPGDECGPEAMHVILLDNGRSRLLAGDDAEILGCIRCGACLNACPIYKSIGGHAYGDTYPGPVGAIVTPGLRGLHGWSELPAASTLCGACRDVCPVRLDIPRMLLGLRRETVRTEKTPLGLRLGLKAFGWIAPRPKLYRAAAAAARRLVRARAREGWVRRLPGLGGGWTQARDLRAPAATTFQEQWTHRQQTARATGSTPGASAGGAGGAGVRRQQAHKPEAASGAGLTPAERAGGPGGAAQHPPARRR
ncbi:MAG: iron-sulfur cluster-binding protein [Acidobacteria bacterium]|nr:MAG: iron-sulfur cluster-binding protein [Acidobacteriota bacterium]